MEERALRVFENGVLRKA